MLLWGLKSDDLQKKTPSLWQALTQQMLSPVHCMAAIFTHLFYVCTAVKVMGRHQPSNRAWVSDFPIAYVISQGTTKMLIRAHPKMGYHRPWNKIFFFFSAVILIIHVTDWIWVILYYLISYFFQNTYFLKLGNILTITQRKYSLF